MLQENEVTAIADVRSSPYSGRHPDFNREALQRYLAQASIKYSFLGEELGARRDEPDCYDGSQAKYELIAQASLFKDGLDRIRKGSEQYRIAMMCAEKDPLTCHRTILVCRYLSEKCEIQHIIGPDEVESHQAAEQRLLGLFDMQGPDLFRSRDEQLSEAYQLQGGKIAYRRQPSEAESSGEVEYE